MATGTGDGGSVQTTAAVALPVGAGLIFATWIVKPSWPPPAEVLTILVAAAAPLLHLFYRAIYRKVTNWAGEEPAQPGELVAIPPGAPAVAVAVVQEPPPVVTPPVASPPVAAPPTSQGHAP